MEPTWLHVGGALVIGALLGIVLYPMLPTALTNVTDSATGNGPGSAYNPTS